ncbi:YfhO family protein [Facklamia sp. P12934]|uniref:YfhO family protein n=1 Tax=Facklamia sp. P12934 TaxID=3421948 RepID=UPI003D16C90B
MKIKSRKYFILVNIFISFLIASMLAYLMKFIPIGDQQERTLLTVDLSQQYIDFFSLYQRALTENPRLFLYSFEKGIGGEMIGLWAYYLMSPFNLILLFFKTENLDFAILFLTLIKLLAISASFYYFVEKKYTIQPVMNIAFSQAYTFMSYTMAYQLNIMWLDGLFWLPLIALGLDYLLKENKPLLYVFSLAIAMISHYYIAYMISIFLMGYSLFVIFEDEKHLSIKKVFSQYFSFIKYSLLSTGLSGLFLLPTFISTLSSKNAHKKGSFDFIFDCSSEHSLMDLLAKNFIGAFNFNQLSNGSANFYVGMTVVVLLILYFLSAKIRMKEKLISFMLLVFYFASFTFTNLDKAWHLGQFPIWYPSRFSFLVSFFLLILAIRSYKYVHKIRLYQILTIVFSLTVFCLFYFLNDNYSFLSDAKIFYSLIFMLLISFIFYLNRKPNKGLLFLILLLTCGDMTLNGYFILSSNDHYVQPSRFKDYIALLDEMIAPVQPKENEFYRIHKTFNRTKNESFFANYPSVNHFGSTLEASTSQLYGYLGIPHTSNSIYYTSGTLFTDDFLNIRYLIDITSNTNMYATVESYALYREVSDFDIRAHQKLKKEKRYVYYKNPNVLGLGMEVSPVVIKAKFKKYKPIENQEILLDLLNFDGEKLQFFEQKKFKKIDYLNLNVTNKGDGDFYTYKKENPKRDASFALSFDTESNNPFYFTFPNHFSNNRVELILDSKPYEFYSTTNSRQIMDAAFKKSGKEHSLRVKLKKNTFKANLINLYEFNLKNYQQLITKRKNKSLKITSFEENTLEGQINIEQEEGYLLMTLPYDPYWHVKVDNQSVEALPVLNDTLMAIPMTKGKHTIKMTYFPDSIYYGGLVSFLAIALLIVDQNKFRHKNK